MGQILRENSFLIKSKRFDTIFYAHSKYHVRFFLKKNFLYRKFQNPKLFFIHFPISDGKMGFRLEE